MNDEREVVLPAVDAMLRQGANVTVEPWSHRIWRVQEVGTTSVYFAKVFRLNSGASGFYREVHALRCIREIGSTFPIPGVVGHVSITAQSGHRWGVLMTVGLPGYTLEEAIARRTCDRSEGLHMLGELLAQLHRSCKDLAGVSLGSTDLIDFRCAEHVRLLTLRGEHEIAKLARDTHRWFQRIADAKVRRCVFCHGDVHMKNIFVQLMPERDLATCGVLDWESSCIMWPEFDIAKSVVVTTTTGGIEERMLVEGYGGTELQQDALNVFKAFHAIDGFLYGRNLEGRDAGIWSDRIQLFAECIQHVDE